MKLSEFIKETRRKREISRTELAERLSLTESEILRFEVGLAVPNLEQLKIIAISLDVPLDDLLDCDGVLFEEGPENKVEEENDKSDRRNDSCGISYQRDFDGTISSSCIDERKAKLSRIYGVYVAIPLLLIGIVATIIGAFIFADEFNNSDLVEFSNVFTVFSLFTVITLIVTAAISLVGAYFFSKLKSNPKTFSIYMLVIAIINMVIFFVSLAGATLNLMTAATAAMQLMLFLFMTNKMKSVFPSKVIAIINIVLSAVCAVVFFIIFFMVPFLLVGILLVSLASVSSAVSYYFVTTSFVPSLK